ncbi:DUF4440 domain-containing protein [Alloacidobacterium dinghuense]|uniref:DUF4440 domain-containing protein n=1 Tax=Alloacidobacterium dinghuense TaxID=2763107 RepID=A0A7G8BPA8_9BACT|nr:DUF4440 domain-containing protein [Alloacidobacterium dinghuense]QNI34378.1 DUF4440 domain-containing protein [Alloacidobacterium dinghuense]
MYCYTLLLVVVAVAPIAPPDSPQTVTQVLRAKDQALLDAIAPGNVKVWDAALAEEAVYVDENGVILDRAAFLKQLTPLPPGASGTLVISSYQASEQGDVATVIHTDDETENYHGQTLKARYLTTETWQRSENDWKLLQVHTYAVLQDPPAQKLAAKDLDAYAGRYTAGDLIYTLHRDGNRLIGQREGGAPVEWNAELRDVFFIAGQPRIRKIFQRDANGKITGFVDRRKSWDLVWKKTG